jgi:hypothetical protein
MLANALGNFHHYKSHRVKPHNVHVTANFDAVMSSVYLVLRVLLHGILSGSHKKKETAESFHFLSNIKSFTFQFYS